MSIKKVLVLPDIHIPYHDTASLRAVEAYMGTHSREWSDIIYLGDVLDLDCISSFNEKALRKVEGSRIARDYEKAKELMNRHKVLAPLAKLHWIEGNHEDRVNRYIDANPQLEGLIEIPNVLHLAQRDVSWVPFWSKGKVLRLGKAMFIHGKYLNKYHTNKHLEAYGENVFYGHTHDVQSITREYLGTGKVRAAQSLGCLCKPLDWMQGAPDNWQQAFGVFYFMPDGWFTYYVVRIFRHRFVSPESDIYSPSGRERASR